MTLQEASNYERIARAISYLHGNFKTQPSLEEIAAHVHLSPFHFQKMFSEWAGLSPKKFLQYLTVEHAKHMLSEGRASLFDTALESGLSGPGRLHDHFISIEGMTPGEYKNGGAALHIRYSFAQSPFGALLIASTGKGICRMAFADEHSTALRDLREQFPAARFSEQRDDLHERALHALGWSRTAQHSIHLHIKGTPFQVKVWESLLKIPVAKLATYGDIAACLDRPAAVRAVGTAVGKNPVAVLIPCHRVIRSSGALGSYRWGSTRKAAIIGREAAAMEL